MRGRLCLENYSGKFADALNEILGLFEVALVLISCSLSGFHCFTSEGNVASVARHQGLWSCPSSFNLHSPHQALDRFDADKIVLFQGFNRPDDLIYGRTERNYGSAGL